MAADRPKSRLSAWVLPWRGWALFLGILLLLCIWVLWQGRDDWRNAIEIREGKGRNVRAADLAMKYGWWAALINGVLLSALLASSRWWTRATTGIGDRPKQKISKSFWIILGFALLAGFVLRAPRMDLSLYNDEAYTLRRQISGEHKDRGGNLEFRQVKWSETVFENELGNNPVLFSILARLSYDNWKASAGAADGEVNEYWYRFPSLAAGMLGILTAAWLGLVIGSPRVALLVAFLVAFHPWHVRYSTEARGYGLVVFLVPLILVGLINALRTGKWRWWLLFAIAQFLAAASFVGVLYFSLVINAAVAGWLFWIWWRRSRGTGGESDLSYSPGLLLSRHLVANVLSGAMFIALMLPHLPQIGEALAGAESHRGTGGSWRWWPDVISYLWLGMPAYDGASASEVNPSVARVFSSEDGRIVVGSMLAAGILMVLGAINAWRRDLAGRCLVIGVAVSPILYFLVTIFRANALYRWHMVFLLPAIVALVANGVSNRRHHRAGHPGDVGKSVINSGLVIRIVLALMVFGGYGFPLEGYVKYSKENPKAMVVRARGATYPEYLKLEKQVHFVAFNCVGVYDPYVAVTPNVAQIREQMNLADSSGREFYVHFARRPIVARDLKATLELLEDPELFELVAVEPGLEENQYINYLYRYRATALPEVD